MKCYVTRYALSSGRIKAVEATLHGKTMIEYREDGGYPQFAHRRDWHGSLEAAAIRAEQMRVAKIAALRKSIARLEKLTFELKEPAQ